MSGFDYQWANSRWDELIHTDLHFNQAGIELAREAYERGRKDEEDREIAIDAHQMSQENSELPLADRLAEYMTVRERFAMAAMQGFCATVLNDEGQWNDAKTIADSAIDVANNLIASLERKS